MVRTGAALRLVSVQRRPEGRAPLCHLSGNKGKVHDDGFTGFNGLFG